MSVLQTTVPVPLWFVALMLLLFVAWQISSTMQTRALRDLFDLYTERRVDLPAHRREEGTPR